MIYANITNFTEESYLNLYYTLLEQPKNNETLEVTFTYNVNYFYAERSAILYDKDDIFDSISVEGDASGNEETVHWTAIILSFSLLAFLTLIVIIVLGRVLKKDFFQSTDIESDSSVEIGWKMIRTESLMPPKNKLLLSCFIGNGLQFTYLAVCLFGFGALGLYYNSQKGNVK